MVENICSVGKLSSRTGEDVSAWPYHVCSKGELLAEEDEGISVLVKVILVSPAFLGESLDLIALVVNDFCIPFDELIVV